MFFLSKAFKTCVLLKFNYLFEHCRTQIAMFALPKTHSLVKLGEKLRRLDQSNLPHASRAESQLRVRQNGGA